MADKPVCSIPDCSNTVYNSRGWCRSHYRRWLKYGDPLLGGTAWGAAQSYFRDVVLTYDGDDCLIWPFQRNRKGYARLDVNGKTKFVSRLVCEHEIGPAPTPEHEAAHSCGKGHLSCVTKRHLSWKTGSENHSDKLAHGTYGRKLTAGIVVEIRRLSPTTKQSDIARMLRVNRSTVCRVINGKAWPLA
jgi:hypothetical protein